MQQRVSVHPCVDEDGGRRVAIYRRHDGCYRYAEETRACWGDDEESTWSPRNDAGHSGIYESPETAMREAERDIQWLKERLRR